MAKGKPVAFADQDEEVRNYAIWLVQEYKKLPNRKTRRRFLATQGIPLQKYRVIEEGVLIYASEQVASDRACAQINARAAETSRVQTDGQQPAVNNPIEGLDQGYGSDHHG